MTFDTIGVHATMLRDRIRTEAYRRAIEAVVKPGDRVLDFGCGTGILSFFACRAGAEVVYAVDRSRMIRNAREIAEANGIGNIRFFKGEAGQVVLPEQVDVIVSETLGEFVFNEHELPQLLTLRDRWLKPGGALIPASVRLSCGLVRDPSVAGEGRFLRDQPYGFDYTAVADWASSETKAARLSADQLVLEPIHLADLDLGALQSIPDRFGGRIEPRCDAEVHALCGWFCASLASGVELGTAPFDPPTSWSQVVLPLGREFRARTGQELTVSIQPVHDARKDWTHWRWSIEDSADRIEMDDIVLPAWYGRPLPDGWLP